MLLFIVQWETSKIYGEYDIFAFLSPFLYCSSTQITDHQLPISRTRIAFQNASFLMYFMAKVAKKRLSFFLPVSLQRQPDIMRQPECRKGDLRSFFTPPTCQNSFSSSKILPSTPRMNIRDKSMKVFKMNPWTNIEFRFLLASGLTIKKNTKWKCSYLFIPGMFEKEKNHRILSPGMSTPQAAV